MKPLSAPLPFFPHLARAIALALAASAFFSIAPRLLSAPGTAADDFSITVRASVDQVYTRFSKEPVHDHGKQYAIVGINQIKQETPLAKPVNEGELIKQLRTILSAYGFHDPVPGTNPDIVLTVVYGRSYLRNPYLDKTMPIDSDSFGGNVVNASVEQLIRERSTPGYADKTISANAEKLFISVTAWKFPTSPKEKPKQLWRTLMLTDDPDQDLNALSKKMLAAGGGYFDRPIEQEEVSIPSSVAEGHVSIGTPTVVDSKKPAK